MPQYRVGLIQTVTEGITLFVEANSEEEAAQLALDQVMTDTGGASWEFVSTEDDPEVVSVEALP